MRTIKFRGQVMFPENGIVLNCDKKEGEWVYGDLHLQSRVPHIHMFGKKYPINPATVGQFTERRDKTTSEIYEGDIVKTNNGIGVVRYNATQWFYEVAEVNEPLDNERKPGGIPEKDWEVLGNIYDNPELLTNE